MKLVPTGLPDPNSPEFAAEMRRQSLAIANAPDHDEIMDWIERNYDWDD